MYSTTYVCSIESSSLIEDDHHRDRDDRFVNLQFRKSIAGIHNFLLSSTTRAYVCSLHKSSQTTSFQQQQEFLTIHHRLRLSCSLLGRMTTDS